MDLSQYDQKSGKPWLAYFAKNAYVFVAYTGLTTQKNSSQWYCIMPNKWTILRHRLEAFGAEQVEDETLGRSSLTYDGKSHGNTMIRAFETYKIQRTFTNESQFPNEMKNVLTQKDLVLKTELHGDTHVFANTFLLLVRCSIPLGGRTYTPIEETFKYNLLVNALQYDASNRQKAEALHLMKEDSKKRVHAADLETKVFVKTINQKNVIVTCEYLYCVPPMDYVCPGCKQFGLHYYDACDFWPKQDTLKAFGSKKMKAAIKTTETDSMFYKSLYKKQQR